MCSGLQAVLQKDTSGLQSDYLKIYPKQSTNVHPQK